MILRDEILPVKELTKRFVTAKFSQVQMSSDGACSIEKSLIKKLGYAKVTGLHIMDVKNPRLTEANAGRESEYITEVKWVYA